MQDADRLLRNAKKLKARLIDTATLLELYSQGKERERQLEHSIFEEREGRRLKEASAAKSAAQVDELRAKLHDRDTAITELRRRVAELEAIASRGQPPPTQQQQQGTTTTTATTVAMMLPPPTPPQPAAVAPPLPLSAPAMVASQLCCAKCALVAREAAAARTEAQTARSEAQAAQAAAAAATEALANAERRWDDERREAAERPQPPPSVSGAAAAASEGDGDDDLDRCSHTDARSRRRIDAPVCTELATLPSIRSMIARGHRGGGGGGAGSAEHEEVLDPVRKTTKRVMVPPKVVRVACAGSVADVVRLLDGPFLDWLCPTSVHADAADGVHPLAWASATAMELSGAAEVAVDALVELVFERGREFVDGWLEALGAAIVRGGGGGGGGGWCGDDDEGGGASLQRAVVLCHIFARTCRKIAPQHYGASGDPRRVRMIAFQLARGAHGAPWRQPVLLAALCCAWPEAFDAPRWDHRPALRSSAPPCSRAAAGTGGASRAEDGGAAAAAAALPPELAPALAKPGAALVAALDLIARRALASTDGPLPGRCCSARARCSQRTAATAGRRRRLLRRQSWPKRQRRLRLLQCLSMARWLQRRWAAPAAPRDNSNLEAAPPRSLALASAAAIPRADAVPTGHAPSGLDDGREDALVLQLLRGGVAAAAAAAAAATAPPVAVAAAVAAAAARPGARRARSLGRMRNGSARPPHRPPRLWRRRPPPRRTSPRRTRSPRRRPRRSRPSSARRRARVCVVVDPIVWDCAYALELLAARRSWRWTATDLLRKRLVPMLDAWEPRGGATPAGGGRWAALRLLGKLGTLAPSAADEDAVWLQGKLRHYMGCDRLDASEQACAVSAHHELLPAAVGSGSDAPSAELADAYRAVGAWINAKPDMIAHVPDNLRAKFARSSAD